MLKKSLSFSLILVIFFIAYQYGVNFLKKSHSISYSVGKKEIFKIDEDYIKNENSDYYLIRVTDKDKKEFIFDVSNIFNKQKQIVEDVSTYEDNGWYCVSLIFSNKRLSSVPLCEKGGTVFSYNYVKNSLNLEAFVSKLPNFEYNKEYVNESETSDSGNSTILINRGYLDDNEIVVLYNYKNLKVLSNETGIDITFSNEDNYKNTLGRRVGNYYIIPKYSSSASLKEYIKFDYDTSIKTIVSFQTSISKQSTFVNGVYNDKLYVFDKSTLTQYEINPETETVMITGNKDMDAFAVIDGKETTVSVYEMNEKNLIFTFDKGVYKDIKHDSMKIYDSFAIYTLNGNVYKVYSKYISNPILLLNEPEAKEIKANNDSVFYIKDDTLFKCNRFGIFIIAKSNEFRYNYENVYDVYSKN